MQSYLKFPESAKLLGSLSVTPPLGDYVLQDGIIRCKGRILVPNDTNLQLKIVAVLHSSPVGGHSCYQVTYHRVKHLFRWYKMKKMIKDIVASCQVCQQAKSERIKYCGLLQPLLVLEFAWQIVTMDFIEGLPKSHKYAYFIPLSHPFTTLKVVEVYWTISINCMVCLKLLYHIGTKSLQEHFGKSYSG